MSICFRIKYLIPLLKAFIDRHPDVKVNFRIGDVVARQEVTQAGGVLLQHVAVVLPATAVCEHLQHRQHIILLAEPLNLQENKVTMSEVMTANDK